MAEDPGRAPTGTVTDPKGLLVESDGLEFRFSYFPSLDRLRVLVLHPAAKFATWEVTLSAQGRSEVLAQRAGKLPMAAAGETIPLPALADGTYEVKLTLIAQDGSRRELQRTFQRKHFPWEKNHLGQDRVVIPPFTPLVASVDPASVSCVLRRHDMDGTGLWKQVVSQGHELLAVPMRLEIESQGKTYIAAGNRLALAEKAADRVQGGGTWTAGPIAGRTEFAFDYDGMMKVTFQLGTAGQRLDAMQLVIPLKTDEAWLMHAVTDLLRFHYAGRIPDGKGLLWDYGGATHEQRYTQTGRPDANGKVWDSGHVGRWQLPGPFVPYVWLGGPERGIAWFAENDRDWSLAADRPTLEIRRQGAVTTLVVHMVTRGVTLARPRHDNVRPHGHARQADARKPRELPPLVDRPAQRKGQEQRGLRPYGGLLLLGLGWPLLRLSSGLCELRHLRRVRPLAEGRRDGPGLSRQVARPVHGPRICSEPEHLPCRTSTGR